MIHVDHLSYLYPGEERPALQEIDFHVEAGAFVALTGPTGSGKTTLALALVGLVPRLFGGRFFGRITVAGMETLETEPARLTEVVGLVFDDPDLQLMATSVAREVAFPLENRAMPRAMMRQRVDWALEAVGLRGLERRSPARLSGGQKQRLAIAAALATRPQVLVLDEPTTQLDPQGAEQLLALLSRLHREWGMTILLITRDSERAARYAQRLLILDGGRLVADGPIACYGDGRLLRQHRLEPSPVVRLFEQWRERGCCHRLPLHRQAALESLPALVERCPPRCPPPPPASPSPAAPLLQAESLHFAYRGGGEVLHDLSLTVHQGELLLLAGANGAGKSTFVRLALRLLVPRRGVVRWRGRPTTRIPFRELAAEIGYVAQNPDTQLFNSTVVSEIAFALRGRGLEAAEMERRVEAALATLELGGVRDRHPLALPRGMRTRVVIAAVLALDPKLLILDEPTAAQDAAGTAFLLALMQRLRAEGRSLLVISHHLEAIAPLADRMAVMAEGRLLAVGPTREVLADEALLASAALMPPTVVAIGRRLCPRSRLLTEAEVADVVG